MVEKIIIGVPRQNEALREGGSSGAPSALRHMLGKLLLPDETAALRKIASALSRQYEAIFPIGDLYEERLEALSRPQRCNDHAGKDGLPQCIPLSGYPATDVSRQDTGIGTESNIHTSGRDFLPDGSPGNAGPRGRSGDNPIDAIAWDLKRLRERIETLCDTGILQTTSPLSASRTFFHLSDDGSIHVRTDIPIGSSCFPSRRDR